MPRCADDACGRWRPSRFAPRWLSGIRFNDQWYCSRACVESAARDRLDAPALLAASAAALPPMKLGVFLRHMSVVSEADLAGALDSQRASGRRLGAELQALGLVSSTDVLRALAAQGGVSYLRAFDARRAASGPSWLPVETVRALGLVPFEVDERTRTVRVVCAAPVPRSALRALSKLTAWTAEPYLVEDDIWREAMRAYRVDAAAGRLVGDTVAVRDRDDAAAEIARSAHAGRVVTMRHAQYERRTWVRVEAERHVSDMWIAAEGAEEWLAESIAR